MNETPEYMGVPDTADEADVPDAAYADRADEPDPAFDQVSDDDEYPDDDEDTA